MRQNLLVIIAVLAAAILALFSIDTANNRQAARSYRAYSHIPADGFQNSAGLSLLLREEGSVTATSPTAQAAGSETSGSPSVLPVRRSLPSTPPPMLAPGAMTELTSAQLPPLDAGMVNVTGGSDGERQTAGYRAAPYPGEFAIAVPYDPAMLPQGFTEEDIQTYVYDRQYHRWTVLQRDSVIEAEQVVFSRFNPWERGLPHAQSGMADPQEALAQVRGMMSPSSQGGGDSPLDFINAVLKTPEMPETSSYTPTSIKELKAANPLEGLQLMQPPTANNNGTANLSYPIEIPAGRQGMQPSLALTYSSGGGNSWLGVGWDLSIPSITVETRWGVPRYDQNKESEVYLLNGEQLVTKDEQGNYREMPHRTNQWTSRLSGEVRFHPRKDEAFDSIVRHGTGPDNYWWSVTDRGGVTHYYGKYRADSVVNNDCVLRTDATNLTGAIAHWALAESVDPFGNSVRYHYRTVFEKIAGGNTIGKAAYIETITYTNSSNEEGPFTVNFNRGEDKRQDVSISANRGFLEVTAATLCHIDILFNDTVVREYMFFDTLGRFSNYKTLLTDVVRIDRQNMKPIHCGTSVEDLSGENVTRTHFDYFEAPDADNMFGEEQTIGLASDDVGSFFVSTLNMGGQDNATALGATRGKSWNAGGTASVGLGPNVAMTSISVGGNFSYSRSKNEGALTLIDLDGDGLADKVFKIGRKIVYRPRIQIDDTTFAYGDTLHIDGVSNFLQDESSTTSWGLQASAGLAYSGSWPTTRSTTTTYFSDVNADGLPDLITEEGVLFNVTEPGGRVRFNSFYTMVSENQDSGIYADSNTVHTSADSCQGIIFDGEVSDSIICYISWIWDTSFNVKSYSNTFPQEVLNFVDSLEATGEYWCDYWYSADPPKVTDIIVYRKVVDCQPIFSQTANSSIETISDPDMESVRVWVPQKSGTASIRSRLQLLDDGTESHAQSKWRDGVSYSIQICRNVTADNNHILHAASYDTLFTRHVHKDDTTLKDTTFSVYVGADDLVFFRLVSGDNHDFDKVSWKQTITFSGTGSIDKYGVNDNLYDSQRDFTVSGQNYFAVSLEDDNAYVRASADIHSTTPYVSDNHSGYRLRIEALDSNANRMAHIERDIENNMSQEVVLETAGDEYIPVGRGDMVRFYLEKAPLTSSLQKFDWSEVRIVPHVEYFIRQGNSYVKKLDYHPPVTAEIDNYTGTGKDTAYHVLFGPLYRGWGQFAYNNNDTANGMLLHDSHIRLNRLVADSYSYSENQAYNRKTSINGFSNHLPGDTTGTQESSTMLSCFETAQVFNPIASTTGWIEMQPDCKNQAWVGYGNVNYLTADIMSNTRLPEYSADTNTVDIAEYDHPVPIVTDHEVKTVRKQNISKMKNHSLSFSFVPVISIGTSYSNGENIILTDYMDLNGDRYPDIVGQSMVQYSNPWGGIGNPVSMGPLANGITKSETNSIGATFGGSFQMPTRGSSNNPKNSKISFDGSGNPGANLGGGSDNTAFSWMDVNGDGLPDKVLIEQNGRGLVSLNTGYGFQASVDWGSFSIRNGDSENAGFNFGANFNVGQASIGGGMGVNFSRNKTLKTLIDFNGDGLPDLVEKGGNGLSVRYNLGNGSWSATEYIGGLASISYGCSFSESVNASVTVGFTLFSILKVCVGVSGSPYNKTFSRDSLQLVDVNGDGYVDYVTSNSEYDMTVRYNRSGKTNLLRKVTNFTGSIITLDYDMPLSSYEKPQRSWNLASVETRNNVDTCAVGGNRTLTTFAYGTPNYVRAERMDYGYDAVTTYQYDTDNGDALYRYTVENYDNQQFSRRGKKNRDCLYDAQGNPYIENLYEVVMADLSSGDTTAEACPSIRYKKRETDIRRYYEGDSQPHIVTAVQREYDKVRNVTRYVGFGYSWNNPAGTDEYFSANIHYKTGMPHNLISLQDSIVVRDKDGNILQKRSARYSVLGKMTHLTQYNSSGGNAEYDFQYDGYGNLTRAEYPKNLAYQRFWCRYYYDSVLHSLPVRVENALGYYSSAEYDYKFGKPIRTTDINGNEMRYSYDTLGRLTTVLAPDEIADSVPYTIRMEYAPCHYGEADIFTQGAQPYSYAITYHYDRQHPNNPIKTTLICDGFGRLLQTKKDAEIGGAEVSLVTGKMEYDCFGRTLKQYHPFTESLNNATNYNGYFDPQTLTTTAYDILDRQTKVVLPTGDSTVMDYDFGTYNGNTYFKTETTDALGNALTTLSGSRQQQIQTIAPGSVTTTFAYDVLGQLLQSTDPDNISTHYEYDMLGRLTQRTHPDAGTDTYTYDPAGNMVAHKTQKLQNAGDSVKYNYHYNQLTSIIYPENPANNVYYTYGAMGAADNAAGRIVLQEDASGWQKFSYGKLGEVTKNIRTFALPNEEKPYTFVMSFEYDSWNRIQEITYPDGEVVGYDYNLGGMLCRVSRIVRRNYEETVYDTLPQNPGSVRSGGGASPIPVIPSDSIITYRYPYIDSIAYNEFELKDYVRYGNGTQTTYDYDILQRLSHLHSETGQGEIMQEIDYTYDAVSNITDIENTAGTLSNGLGGKYENSYTYDNLYRLKSANGNWNGVQTCGYNLRTAYHRNGRIKQKQLTSTTYLSGVSASSSYTNSYGYSASQPNTLSSITVGVMQQGDIPQQQLRWDANGNMVFHRVGTPVLGRRLCWDEENRLMGVADDSYVSYYQYDATGERTYKLTGKWQMQRINGQWYSYCVVNTPTLYASPYLVVTPQGYTKHYYAEAERITSQIGRGNFSGINTPVVGDSLIEAKLQAVTGNVIYPGNLTVPDSLLLAYLDTLTNQQDSTSTLYFYHPDHLGSGSWITFTDGDAVQHLHYLPWGESMVDQRFHLFEGVRYTFSAKEKDTETGYGYFGARYYSSDLSIWLSVDPMADKYPSLSPYVYCANNPIKLVDPNGMEFGDFYDSYGRYVGTDGKKDGKLYILNNKNISNEKQRETRDYIKQNSGQSDKFDDGCIAYRNSTEIIADKSLRESMCSIAEQDDGKGGMDPSRNCEYGGKLVNGAIVEIPHGPVSNPTEKNVLVFPGEALFHTHASGTSGVNIDIYNLGAQFSGPVNESYWEQVPSKQDIANAGNTTHYVFGRANNKVYLYNGNGVHVEMSHDVFKNIRTPK